MTDTSSAATAKKIVAASAIAVPFVGFTAGMQGASANIGSTALVSASRHLDMSGGTQALAASVQTLAIAATVITTGLIADRIGRRKMLMIALGVTCIGQLVVAVSPAAAFYLIGMAITGIGMGATYGAAFGFLESIVPKEKFASAMGIFTAFVMLSGLLFTFIGGVLCGIDWRYAFLLLPVVTLLALVATPFVLPKVESENGGSFDVFGQLLLAVGVIAFLYGCSELANSLTSPKTLGPIIGGIALLIGFFVRESRSKNHFFPISIFRSPVFLAAICAGFIYNFGTAVSFLQVTNLWQYITGLKDSEVSIWQLPLLLSGVFAGVVTGRLIGKVISERVAILGGAVMFLVGAVMLSLAHSSHSLLPFLPGLIVVGAGVIVAAVPFGSMILREAPPGFVGPVTSSRTTVGQIFYTLGFALSMVSIDRLTDIGVISHLKADGVSPTSYGTGLDALNVFVSSGQKPTSTVGQQALQGAADSYGQAFSVTLIGAGVIATIVGIVAFFLLGGGRDGQSESTSEPNDAATTATPTAS
jgi:MFS family permease